MLFKLLVFAFIAILLFTVFAPLVSLMFQPRRVFRQSARRGLFSPMASLVLLVVIATALMFGPAFAQVVQSPTPSPAQQSFATEPSNEYYAAFTGKVDKDRGFSTNQTVALPVNTVYLASGPISLTDHKSLLVCAVATCAMTLANGTIDGYPIIIKKAAASAAVTVAANIDGTAQTLTASTTAPIRLRWDAYLATYDTE